MKAVKFAVGCIAGGMVLQGGCAHITMLRTEELRKVQTQIDSLKAELSAVQEDIRKEQKQQSELLRLIRADQQVRFSQVEKEVSSLTGSIHDSQEKLSRISEKTDDIKKRWDEKAMADSMSVATHNAEIQNLFEIAHGDFMAGRYDVARSGFQDMIDRFPDHPMAEAAFYWKAESYYAQKSYDEAEQAFMAYIKNYADGKKICVALFKLGLVYDSTKRAKARTMVWQKLLTQCPDSEEAEAVKARM